MQPFQLRHKIDGWSVKTMDEFRREAIKELEENMPACLSLPSEQKTVLRPMSQGPPTLRTGIGTARIIAYPWVRR